MSSLRVEDRRLTVEELYALPEDGWIHELQAGLLVSEPLPAPLHGRVVARLTVLLGGFVRERRLGVVLSNDTGYLLARSPDTVRGPDVSFVSRARYEQLEDETRPFPGSPDLAVEVRSPSNTQAALQAKVADYLAAGTKLVWVVDPQARCIAVYRSLLAPRFLRGDDELDGEDVVVGFRVPLAAVFEL